MVYYVNEKLTGEQGKKSMRESRKLLLEHLQVPHLKLYEHAEAKDTKERKRSDFSASKAIQEVQFLLASGRCLE